MKKHIIFQIKSLNLAIFQNIQHKVEIKPIPTPTQMQIIHYLKKHDDVYQKDLTKNLNLSRATLSEVLKTMEKNELISKISNETDGRINKIVLNKKANDIFDKAKRTLKNTENKLIENINEEDLNIFLSVVNKMKENLKRG